MKPTLLIVDDDEEIRTQMKWALGGEYELRMAGDRTEAIAAFQKERPAATLLDLGLPPQPNECAEGLAALSELLAIDSAAKVIIISGQGERQNAINAVGAGISPARATSSRRGIRADGWEKSPNARGLCLHPEGCRHHGARSPFRR